MNYIIVCGCYGNYDETQLGEQKWNEMDNCQHDHHYPSITIMHSEEFQHTTTTKKKMRISHGFTVSATDTEDTEDTARPPWHKHRGPGVV